MQAEYSVAKVFPISVDSRPEFCSRNVHRLFLEFLSSKLDDSGIFGYILAVTFLRKPGIYD